MPYKIYSDKDISLKEWDTLTGNSFFASIGFASLWRALDGEPLYYLDEESGKIKAGIGGIVFGKYLFKRYDSMPDGLFGGPFFTPDYDAEKRKKFLASFEKYIKRNNFIRANINRPSVDLGSNMFKIQTAFEHVLELSEQGYRPRRRAVGTDIRGAERRGTRVELLESETDLERLSELARASARRQGRKTAYPCQFFYRLLKLSAGNKNILWLKAMVDNKMIASQITFFEKEAALNWAFYYDKEQSYYKPGYLLADYALRYSIEKGLKYFSMGSTPGRIESVIRYKEAWGCREQSYNNYMYRNILGKLICGRRRR
ncbi:MAG: hypothetical protein DRP51_05945 [Candidatus Zixiibacteriota bacterium]|nr:MAG: hypothetical protein DRP51_05945 [candidate division Zixibacteria bacterium]